MQKAITMLGILLTCLFLVAQSGHIYPQDIQINPNNKNTPSDITLVFSLDTSLAPTDYLRIIFPFRLNSVQPALWDQYINCTFNTTTNKRAIVTASTLSGDSTSYFVQFYTDLTTTTLSNLNSSVVYYLKITGTPDPSAQTGLNSPVQLLTVSNNKGNWVIYDSNSVFGTLTLADAYPSTMTVSVIVPSTQVDSTVLGNSYTIRVDITPKKTLTGRARVDIQFTNTDFSLLTCKSINSTSEGISLLPATFLSLNTYTIRATISKTLTAGNGAKYRFECTVRNPANTGTTKIIVKNRMGYTETIAESGTDSVGLTASTTTSSSTTTTSGWEEASHQVLLGWGYPAHLSGALSIFSLYKDASPTERWYQSVKTVFKPKAGLTATDNIQVVISTVNDASFKILTASIYHNLPSLNASNPVSCSVVTQGYLTCSNVGTLAAQQYWVSFRFNLLSTATVNTVSDFGKVRVQTQATSPVVLIALSTTTLANKVVKTNVALYTSSSTNGVVAYSTTKTGSTTTKYVTNGENVILKFAFKYFTNTFIPLSTANIERGIEFYTSQALAASTSPTCSISGLTQTTDILITNCAVEALTSFSRLRFRIQKFARVNSGTPPYAQFTSTAQDGTILFDYVQFGASQFSSLNYVNENVFDYYARWVQDFTAATNPSINIATGSSSFFFNSLVYKNGALSNVQVGTTFFVTGASASDASNDGTSFPTLIRVTGYLATGTIDEQTGTTRLLLFFNDLEPLNTVTPCFGPTGIACNYVANGVENTQTDLLTDYSGSRRIEIQIDPTQRFNIYIPVKTISQKTSIGFFVTTASTIDATQGIFATRYSKRINQVTSTMTTLAIDPVGSTPKVSVTGTPTMGSAIDTSITGITSSYVPSAANTASLIGAAYGYCANFDFTATSGFTFKPFYTSSATPEQYCVSIKYSPTTSKDVTCHVCPVHSTMPASNAAVTKFTLPTMAGQDFYDLVYVVGNNNGDFLKAAKDNQATVMAAKTLSGLGITFTPTVFKKANKNVYARVNFTASIPLPKNIRINITPTGSSTSLLVLPVSTVSCNVLTTTATSCVTSGSATNIQIDAVAQGSTWAAGGHAIDFMIDASTAAASISADAVINFAATIKVDGITALSALHHSSPASPPTFTIKNQASNYIGLYNISYLFGNKNARSVISFVFELPNDIKVYPAQTIVFNLGGIATANVGETPICFVRDYTTQIVSNDFASCDVSDLTQLTLQAKATVTGNYTVELQFIHIPSSAAPAGISAKVLAADGSTIVAQNLPSSPLTLPQTPSSSLIPALNVNLNRLYSDPGNVAEVVLSIRPSVKAVAIATHLYLYFPTYYADKLGYQNIWCIANNLPVQCSIMGSRIVHLSSFPVEVAVGSVLTIRVYGIITPVVPSPAGKIFIGLADSDNVFQLTEQLEVTDITSSASFPTALTIDTFSATTQKIRETADYTIAFTTDAVGIRTTRKITIDFPDRYGNILGGIDAPTILLSKTGNTTTTSIQAASIGSRFKITPPYDLDPKTSYTFVIKGIDNPEDSTCYMDKPMISITDSTESVAISRTAPNIWNVPNMDYTTDASLKALSWVDTSGNPVTMLLLSIGIFSQEIRIVPPSTPGTFGSDITFSQSQAALTLLPDSLSATKGTPYLSLRVSATSSTFPRIILLDLNKDESYTTNIYSELPKLQLVLTNNKNTLPTNAIRIVQGGTSLPYSWDLEALDLIPNTELKMDVSINQPTLSPLSVLGASSISFGPSTTQAGFTFTLSSTADPTSPPSFTVVLGGTDSNNYQLYNSTVTVTVESPNTVAPVLSEYTPTPNYGPTTQQFGLKTDQMASVYWHVAYEGKLTTTDCLRVRSKYNEGVSFDSSSPTQAQYGVFYVYTENVVSNQVVKNLLSHEVYSYVLCPANQLDYMGANTTGTFTTKDNLSRLAKVSITFTQALTTTQLTSLVCLFKKEFQLPDLNAVAMDGTTCLTSSVLDDKSVFDYKTLEIYLNGDRSSVFDSSMITNLAISVQNVSTQTASTFLTTFNQGLRGAGLTGLYQSIALETGITYSLPTFPSTDYKPSTTIFDTKVNLYGLQLSSGPGFFYAIATEDTTVVPTQAEIKAKLNGKDTTSPGGNVMYKSDSANITLTGLTADTDYLVYYYASTADRTQYVRVTDVNVIKVRTKPTIDSSGHSRMEMSIAMVTFMTVIAWLF